MTGLAGLLRLVYVDNRRCSPPRAGHHGGAGAANVLAERRLGQVRWGAAPPVRAARFAPRVPPPREPRPPQSERGPLTWALSHVPSSADRYAVELADFKARGLPTQLAQLRGRRTEDQHSPTPPLPYSPVSPDSGRSPLAPPAT